MFTHFTLLSYRDCHNRVSILLNLNRFLLPAQVMSPATPFRGNYITSTIRGPRNNLVIKFAKTRQTNMPMFTAEQSGKFTIFTSVSFSLTNCSGTSPCKLKCQSFSDSSFVYLLCYLHF